MRLLSATFFASLVVAPFASASELTILDCDGKSVANYSIDRDHATVNISVKSLGEGISQLDGAAKLISSEGVAVSSQIKLGTAVFEGIATGTWRFCSDPAELSVQNVAAFPSESPVVREASSLLAVGGGIVGVGSLIALSGGGSSSAPGAASTVSAANSEVAFSSGTSTTTSGSGGVSGINVQNQSAAPCFIGDDVTPMSPFS